MASLQYTLADRSGKNDLHVHLQQIVSVKLTSESNPTVHVRVYLVYHLKKAISLLLEPSEDMYTEFAVIYKYIGFCLWVGEHMHVCVCVCVCVS